MTRSGLGRWAVAALGALCLVPSLGADEYEQKLKTTLLVQAAMQQARECLKLQEYGSAVRLLEGQLADANGNPLYLAMLEEAYRHHIAQLQKDGRADVAQRYQERWQILKPQVKETSAIVPASFAPRPPAETAPAKVVARGQDAKETPTPKADLAQAHQLFEAKRYQAAAQHFARAATANLELPPASKERWAYCKLFVVTQQLNQGGQTPALEEMEQEVRQAMAMAPRLDYGQKLLSVLNERRGKQGNTPPAQPGEQTGTAATHDSESAGVRHLPEQDGWQVAESANFRLHHRDRQAAEEVLTVAEKARMAVHRKWLGNNAPANWTARCDIYLHPTAQDYTQVTHMPADAPGHSDIKSEGGDATKVTGRRIDLHADLAYMLHSILPHEVTHVTLAGHFGTKPLPRWADEGLAMLSETYERIGQQLQPLPAAYETNAAFAALEMLQSTDYPDAARLPLFYAQSACLVQYLTQLRGPVAFTAFLKDGNQRGFDTALRIHYGLEGPDLDQRLKHFVLVQHLPGLNVNVAAQQ